MRPLIAAFVLALSAGAPVHAGEVQVRFEASERFADFGFGVMERERNQAELTGFLKSLSARVPEGQTLRIEVLDVNLAGEVDPLWRHGETARILRDVTLPRIQLRYEWRDASRVLGAGTVELRDLNYLHARRDALKGETLEHEKRLLERWFTETVLGAARR